MALRLAMRRTGAASKLLNRLINRDNHVSKPSSSSRATFFTRFNHTIGVYTYPNGEEFRCCLDEFPLNRGSVDAKMDHPFQVTGPRGWYEVKRLDEGLFVRIDMPGIAKEDVKVWVEYGNLNITGQGRKESPLEATGRGYSGQLEFPANLFREKDMKHELKNGVLRVFIPKSTNKVS